MEKSLFVQFQQHSTDFLRLLGEKSARAKSNKSIQDELEVLELFWDGVEAIFQKYEERIHVLKLTSVNEHAKAVILESELKRTYNELYRTFKSNPPQNIIDLMKSTNLPSKKDLEKNVNLK